jgi:hypothetical protein
MTASIPRVIPTDIKQVLHHWKPATWEDYVAYRDAPTNERMKLFFNENSLLVIDMGWEGINHAIIRELFTLIFGFWFMQRPEQIFIITLDHQE